MPSPQNFTKQISKLSVKIESLEMYCLPYPATGGYGLSL
jgi:hypothetical protein